MDIKNGKMVARKVRGKNGKEYSCILLVSEMELPPEIPQDTQIAATIVIDETSLTINATSSMPGNKYKGWLIEDILRDF